MAFEIFGVDRITARDDALQNSNNLKLVFKHPWLDDVLEQRITLTHLSLVTFVDVEFMVVDETNWS